jgi:hypothetical protein
VFVNLAKDPEAQYSTMAIEPLSRATEQIEPILEPPGSISLDGRNKGVKEGDAPARIAVDVPPNGGYGWVNVVCVFLINAHTWGVNSVSDVFSYMTSDWLFYILFYV